MTSNTNSQSNKFKYNILKLLKRYNHAWVFLYVFIYAPWFLYLEKTVTIDTEFTNIHVFLDDYIPFIELFVIPYIFWFLYVAIFIGLFFFISKDEFYRITAYMFIGMTICLCIYTIFPNGHSLRLTSFPRDNFLVDLVKGFYTSDTCTNVLPSIHSFNSLVILIAVIKSKTLKRFKYFNLLKLFCAVSSILIMLSTVFIKQHSILDMFAAIILSAIMYPFIYTASYNLDIKSEKISDIA